MSKKSKSKSKKPKMKTHKGAKKRFKVTGTGKVRRRNKNLNHFLEKKASRRKRRLRGESEVSTADEKRIKNLLSS